MAENGMIDPFKQMAVDASQEEWIMAHLSYLRITAPRREYMWWAACGGLKSDEAHRILGSYRDYLREESERW
jgi:hypothetical protein